MNGRTLEFLTEMGALLILTVILFLVYFGTFYPDQNWGGDFAQYIHQAINIAHGIEMADTGYIYSRYSPVIGPRVYPPGFPLLLVPTYMIFGFNIGAFQVQMILMQLLALVVIYLLYRREVAKPTTLILLLMMGLSPYLISFKRAIMSDIPFMLAGISFVLWIEYVYEKRRFNRWTILVAAMLAFACYLIRTIGFVMIGALLFSDLIRRKRPTYFTIWTTGLVVVFVIISRLILGGGEESYLDQLANYSFLTILKGFEHYLINSIRGFWAGPSLHLGDYIVPVLWLLAIPLILWGFIRRTRGSTLFMELFFLFHLTIILAWPSIQELRFLYPILPLFLLYAGIGFEESLTQLKKMISPRRVHALAMLFAVGIIIIYGVRTQKVVATEGPITDGPYTPEAMELFQFVREKTEPEAIFVFYKPRVLALYTDRHASAFPENQPMPVVIDYLEEISTDYVVVKKAKEVKVSESRLVGLIQSCQASFEQVFDNEMFSIYRLDRNGLKGCKITAYSGEGAPIPSSGALMRLFEVYTL
jgi:hypothetical protein